MSREIVAGRLTLKKIFKEHFARAIDDGRDTRSFHPFRKQKEMPAPSPWIYLFHGNECLGKSTAIHFCLALSEEVATELKRSVRKVVVDMDELSFIKGCTPTTKLELMDTIIDAFEEADSELKSCFSRYKALSERYRANLATIPAYIKKFQLNKIVAPAESGEIETIETPENILRSALSAEEFDLYESGEAKLAELLVSAISSAAEEVPLLLAIDGYSKLQPDLELWLRSEVLTSLASKRNSLIVLIGGDTTVLRGFRNTFTDETLFMVNFADATLTRQSIAQLISKKRLSVSENDIDGIESCTAGVPLLVHDILFYAGQGIAIDKLIDGIEKTVPDAVASCAAVLSRFSKHCTDGTIQERVFSLAMLPNYNAKALAEIWNIQFADVKKSLDSLEKLTPFIRDHAIHPHVLTLLRSTLITEASKSKKSALRPFFENFTAGSSRVFSEALQQFQTAIVNAEKRCTDQRYTTAIEQYICGMLWTSPADALKHLPGFFLELLNFNLSAAQRLLAKIAEFRPLFSSGDEVLFKLFVNALSYSDKALVFNRYPVKEGDEEFIVHLESALNLMSDFQRALFYHLKAEMEIRKNSLKEAKDHLDNCFSILGNSSPEKSILYENYVILALLFHAVGEHRDAVDSFSSAVLINPEGFITWYYMGISRMELQEYEGAINALSEAVKIDPVHAEAWYSLGTSFIYENLHSDAVGALQKAVEFAPDRPDILFALGNSYRAINHFADSIKAYRAVVQKEEKNVDAWILLGHSCVALGSAEEAIEAFRKAIALKPNMVEPLMALGYELFRLQKYEEAADIFTKASQVNNNDDHILCMIAESYIGSRQYAKAVEAGNSALAIDGNSATTYAIIGNAEMLLGNLQKAIEMFQKSVSIHPENAPIWQKLGIIYNKNSDHSNAIDAFKKAVSFDPSLKEVWYTIGKAYETQEQYEEAVASYDKGVHADPLNGDCWFRKGEMHSRLEQFGDAFLCYSKVVELDPAAIDAWFNRGSAATKNSDFNEAIASFKNVVMLEVKHTEGWFNLGLAHQSSGDNQEAIRCFTEAVAIEDARTDIWYQLGLSCQTLGIFEEAISAFEMCTELDSESDEYATRLGTCYFTLGRYGEAYEAYKKAVDLAPDNVDTLFQLALTAHAQEHYEEAITHYRSVTSKNSDHAEAWFNCALSYHAVSKFDEAIEVYEEYIKKWPTNSIALFNMGLAYHAKSDLDHCIKCYRDALKIQQDNSDIWYNLGLALQTKELFGDAIQAYRKVLQFSPDNVEAWFNLGMSYSIWENFTDAIDSYTNVVQRNPQNYVAWGYIALAHYSNGTYEQGFDAAIKAFELKSDEPWLIGNMVIGYLFTGDSIQAQEFVEKLVAADYERNVCPQIVAYIQDGLKRKPDVSSAAVIVKRLQETEVAVSAEQQ